MRVWSTLQTVSDFVSVIEIFDTIMERDEAVEKEQHFVIRYCVRRGLSATDTLSEMKGVYRDDFLSRTAIFCWLFLVILI